jgi:hypothetical protein
MARALAHPDPSVEGSPGAGQRPPGALAGSVSAA